MRGGREKRTKSGRDVRRNVERKCLKSVGTFLFHELFQAELTPILHLSMNVVTAYDVVCVCGMWTDSCSVS